MQRGWQFYKIAITERDCRKRYNAYTDRNNDVATTIGLHNVSPDALRVICISESSVTPNGRECTCSSMRTTCSRNSRERLTLPLSLPRSSVPNTFAARNDGRARRTIYVHLYIAARTRGCCSSESTN